MLSAEEERRAIEAAGAHLVKVHNTVMLEVDGHQVPMNDRFLSYALLASALIKRLHPNVTDADAIQRCLVQLAKEGVDSSENETEPPAT